jgi:hypothetical protein
MENSIEQELNQDQDKAEEVNFELEGDSLAENLLRGLVLSYETAFNKHNEKNEVHFQLTISNHKIATKDGNKDVAYLRLDRGIRTKDFKPLIGPDGQRGDEDDGWSTQLLHQEIHFFRDMKERLNPKAPWKENLFMNAIGRLVGAGLEYAELLQRMKQVEEGKKVANIQEDETESRLKDIGLVKSTELPKPLSPDEVQYKEWLAGERAKEGL